jgi:TatD DNase family protein
LERGAFISFSGIVTFPGAAEVADAAELVPEDRLLVETDSPYLAPVPHRGRRNRPAWVTAVGEFIAARRGVGPDAIRDATRRNAAAAFPLLGAPAA